MKILLVCTGNTCRSSMAEVLLKDMIEHAGLAEVIEVKSAGTTAVDGMGAAQQAITVMKTRGLDLSNHTSTSLSTGLLSEADLVLTMTRRHKGAILRNDPKLKDKVFTLKEYAGPVDDDLDISDPFGQSVDVYQQCSLELEQYLKNVLEKIMSDM